MKLVEPHLLVDDVDTRALELGGWGLTFLQPKTEAAYRAWHVRKAVPLTRIGQIASLLNWAIFLAAVWLVLPGYFLSLVLWFALVMLPVLLGCIALTYSPRMLGVVLPSTMLANVLNGMTIVWVGFRFFQMPDVAMAGATLVAFFGFTIFRLRPGQAAAAVCSYVVLHLALLVEAFLAGRVGSVTLALYVTAPLLAFMSGVLACIVLERTSRQSYRQERIIDAQRELIEIARGTAERERARADDLLFSILPASIAERLKQGPRLIAESFDQVTVLFADVVGFTPLAARVGPERLVAILNELFTTFDDLAARHGVEKIKTIGDAYMAVAGLPVPSADHAGSAAELALALQQTIAEYSARSNEPIELRIGLCSGPAVAGVIGMRKFAYDLWGDTVNTAARMESHGEAGCIQVSESTFLQLRDRYIFEERGSIEVKGKGAMATWWLRGPKEAA